MNRADEKPSVQFWEYPWYVLVTVGLLLIGAVLWLFGIILRLILLFRKREEHV